MKLQHDLVAIPYPAPSIPARFRLYHGGSAKRGYLVTQDPDSALYLGDYVYFSSVRSYARRYLRKRKYARPLSSRCASSASPR